MPDFSFWPSMAGIWGLLKQRRPSFLFELVNRRYGETTTIIASQMSPINWTKESANVASGDPSLGACVPPHTRLISPGQWIFSRSTRKILRRMAPDFHRFSWTTFVGQADQPPASHARSCISHIHILNCNNRLKNEFKCN